MKKTVINLLILSSTLLLATGCGCAKKKTELLDVDTNINEGVIEDKEVDGLKFTNTSLTRIENNWTLVTEVKNNTGADYELQKFKIIFKDADGNIIRDDVQGDVGGIVPNGESKLITTNTMVDLSKAAKVEYEIIK